MCTEITFEVLKRLIRYMHVFIETVLDSLFVIGDVFIETVLDVVGDAFIEIVFGETTCKIIEDLVV